MGQLVIYSLSSYFSNTINPAFSCVMCLVVSPQTSLIRACSDILPVDNEGICWLIGKLLVLDNVSTAR